MESIKFVTGRKKTRGELRLPQQHFIAMDDWIVKLGKEAYISWLQFYTWADRSQTDREVDAIPNSMNNIVKRLGVGKDTFYNKIIRPLWNYGFIDFQQVEMSGNVFLNIVVYEYPQNDPHKATEPLTQIRDYDTDHASIKRERGKQGGRPRGGSQPEPDIGGSDSEPGVVLSQNQGGSQPEPNNVLNQSNDLNKTNETNISQSIKESKIQSESVQMVIAKNKKLTDRLTDVETVYLAVKNEPGYTDVLFISTIQKAAKAKIRVPFTQYLLKAMIKNLNEQKAMESRGNHLDQSRVNLPEWIIKQGIEEYHAETAAEDELNEEKKKEIEELLKALGESRDDHGINS